MSKHRLGPFAREATGLVREVGLRGRTPISRTQSSVEILTELMKDTSRKLLDKVSSYVFIYLPASLRQEENRV